MDFTHFEPVSHSCINQSTDLDSQPIDWLQYEGDSGIELVKMKLKYAICFNLIGKRSNSFSNKLVWWNALHCNCEAMGYG